MESPIPTPHAVRLAETRRERALLWRRLKMSGLFSSFGAFHDFLTWGGGHLLYVADDPSQWLALGPWKQSTRTGRVWGIRAEDEMAQALLAEAVATGPALGFDIMVTAPLALAQAGVFLKAGFAPLEEITVLDRPLPALPPSQELPAGVSIRAARSGESAAVLALDARSFGDFWSLDAYTLAGILHAGDASHFLVAWRGGTPAGYAIAGLSGRAGYLQRVGVDPGLQSRGIGRELVLRLLAWMSGRGASFCTVNTQRSNEKALGLYLNLGFIRNPLAKFIFSREVSPC
ncbi:MAG: GNAT family N-acetyltransferase [Candidatus Geothermincolia bacterium]